MNSKALLLIFGIWGVVAAVLIVGGRSPKVDTSETVEGPQLRPSDVTPNVSGQFVEIIAPLLDPAKIATLKGDRPINTRLYRVLYWLEMAHRGGEGIGSVMDAALGKAGYRGTKRAAEDKKAILSNWRKLEAWGCYSAEGMAELRRGGSPTIERGVSEGDEIALDHILPVTVVPELAAAYFNLDAILAVENFSKGARIGTREKEIAKRWFADGLLSERGFESAIAD